ncbi:MAG: serine/threonine-protein kinase [Candidatus Eremiobacterota bacterium]
MSLCSYCGKINKDNAKFCNGCGNSLQVKIASEEPLPVSTILQNRYKIIQLMKKGTSGFIYKAADTKLDNIFAVKELFHYGKSELNHTAERFKREANILANLSHHGLPGVIDYFVSNGRYYLVIDFIDGYNLSEILDRDGNPGLPQKEVINWAGQVLDVLDYLHNRTPPVIYRDIKPQNIMIEPDGHIVLIDFGIARAIEPKNKQLNTAIGTNGYAPGEQYFGVAEPRSDLYALGATLHHLLTGISPKRFKFERVRTFNPDISPELETIIIKALRYNVEDRFSSATDMKEHLERIPLFKEPSAVKPCDKVTGRNSRAERYRRITAKFISKGKKVKKILTFFIILTGLVLIILILKRF